MPKQQEKTKTAEEEEEDTTTKLTLTCHCRTSTLSLSIPTSFFPLPTHFCHCSICRYTHGTLATIHTPIPNGSLPVSTSNGSVTGDLEKQLDNAGSFTTYQSSERVMRWFCRTCGAHFIDRARDPSEEENELGNDGVSEKWCIATSLVGGEEGSREELWDFGKHIFVRGTGRGGGLAGWVRDVGGRRLKFWNEREREGEVPSEEGAGDWTDESVTVVKDEDEGKEVEEQQLLASCHCQGVQFLISRPHDPSVFNDVPSDLTPVDKRKFRASNDGCTSCRLLSSSAITSWMFLPKSCISLPDGSPYRHDAGTAKIYKSSDGVTRTFCGVCGALVVYATVERDGMVDLGVGLLRGDSVRCEGWLEWREGGVLGYEEDCGWMGLVGGLRRGAEEGGGR